MSSWTPEKEDMHREKAHANYPDAQFLLGEHLVMTSNGDEARRIEGINWLKQAVDNNDADACLCLGKFFADGEHGVEQKLAPAARLFREGAKLGNLDAQCSVRLCVAHPSSSRPPGSPSVRLSCC